MRRREAKYNPEKIKERCNTCIYLINIIIPKAEVEVEPYYINCRYHGDYGWFFWAKEIQNCDQFKPDFTGIMQKIIKEEDEKNEIQKR